MAEAGGVPSCPSRVRARGVRGRSAHEDQGLSSPGRADEEPQGRANALLAALRQDDAADDGEEVRLTVASGFKPTKASSLEQLATLAVVVYAHRRESELTQLAVFAAGLGPRVPLSYRYSVQEIFALESRACRDRGKTAEARKWTKRIRDIGFNDYILSLANAGHEDSLALHDRDPMTVEQETKWRVMMVRTLVMTSELGGSRSLKAKDAARELDQHLAHLRAIWKVKQDIAVERPSGRRAPHPIRSYLFAR